MITKQQALRFLEKGVLPDAPRPDLAAACDQLVRAETQRDSENAVRLGRQFVRQARKSEDNLLPSALRALGWACVVVGKYRDAEQAYLEARSLLSRDAILRARIDRILIDIYMYLGDNASARRRGRQALRTFEKAGCEAEAAKTRVNYANLLHRQDRHREARDLYQESAGVLKKHGEDLALALCWYNLANTQVQLFEFDDATVLYEEAEEIFRRLGHDLHATSCRYGLAWLHMLKGSYHIALRDLAECELRYRQGGQPREIVLVQMDRAEAFLGLNLFADAKRSAQEAEKGARRLGIEYEASKAAFYFAQASIGLGRRRDALRALDRAQDGFKKERNEAFLAATHLMRAQVESGSEARDVIEKARLRFRRAQQPLWEAVCDLKILSDWPEEERVYRRLATNPAVDAVPHLFARRQTALGDRAARRGNMTEAIKFWSRAAERLETVRAKLPPIEMRSSFFRHQSDPYRKLIEAHAADDPVLAAAWSERFKTAGLWATSDTALQVEPSRRKAEESLAELAARVTALSVQLDDTSGKRGGPARATDQLLARLQARARHDLAVAERDRSMQVDRIESLCDLLRETCRQLPVLQFHVGERDIVAFVHQENETRVIRYPEGRSRAADLLGRWQFLVEQATSAGERYAVTDAADERRLLAQIGEWLWQPLELGNTERLLVLPEGRLSNLPWYALSAAGRPLVERHELLFAPSLRHFVQTNRVMPQSGRIEVFVGATEGLTRYDHDWQRLSESCPEFMTVHQPAHREDWPTESRAAIWHYSGHADLRGDNPFYSSLRLADGPMFAADFRLKRNAVGLVTLAACRTGQQTSQPGDEAAGLVRSLLEMGSCNVIASHWAVRDEATAAWMDGLYGALLNGNPLSSAVRLASKQVMEHLPRTCDWAAFTLYGNGKLQIENVQRTKYCQVS